MSDFASPSSSQPLSGKTALVTGASRGIGRAIARRLASDGAHVFVHYNKSASDADALVGAIEQAGGSAESIAANLEDVKSVDRLIDEVKQRLGDRKLDVLVNNAAIAEFVPFAETDAETLDRQLAVNVRAPFQLTSGLVDSLGDGARVLFTSSVVAKTYFPGAPAYAITKGAIDTLTRHLAAELGERGIRVNAIAPGATETDMAGALFETDESRNQIKSLQALKRIGQPEDIAGVAGFLAGPDSAWVTGQVIDVSGGIKL
jgi:NAD(P)-dependent dehydrogenase (short-subunit alcohol dehydrogenase family)